MRFTPNSCNKRRADSRPACDVDRADMIGMVGESARLTNKLRLASSVGFVVVPTLGTNARGVPWIDNHHGNSSKKSLVCQKRSKLKERPSRMHRSLALPDRCPFADVRQIFQRNPSRGALGLGYDTFRDDVVRVGTKAGLLARKTFKVSFGRLGASCLKPGTKMLVSLSNFLDCSSRVRFPVGIKCDVPDPQIHSEPVLDCNRRAIGNIDGNKEIELSLPVHKISLSSHSFETSSVVVTNSTGNNDATVEGEQAHTIEPVLEGVEPLIVDDGSVFSEHRTLGLVPLVGFADLGKSTHGMLGGKTKHLPQIAIVELLQTDLVGRLKLESPFRQPRTSFVDPFHRIQKTSLLFEIDQQLDSRDEFHYYRTTMSILEMQPIRRRRFLPALKDGASASQRR